MLTAFFVTQFDPAEVTEPSQGALDDVTRSPQPAAMGFAFLRQHGDHAAAGTADLISQTAVGTVSYQLPTGTPLTVSLPQLQRTPENLPVTVTLNVSDSTPTWLTFDPENLVLSGTAPLQDMGKTYHLTFRAQTIDGLECFLQLVLTLRGQTRH